jgi:hypothetical protein
VITESLAREFHRDGFRVGFRYTRPDGKVYANPRPGGDWKGVYSLSLAERDWMLRGGLAIGLVQFGVFGDPDYGTRNGHHASVAARALGAPRGITHYADVEGSGPAKAGTDAVRRYIQAWALANNAGGDLTGLYRTGQVPLSSAQTYGLRGVTSYWAAAGPVPPNPLPRGDAICQDTSSRLNGILVDTDTITTDRKGGTPVLLGTPEIVAAWYGEAMGLCAAQLGAQLVP